MRETARIASEVCGEGLRIGVTQEEFDLENFVRYTTFGISVTRLDGEPYMHISDISTDRAFVEGFAGLCIKYRLSGIHIRDALADMLP